MSNHNNDDLDPTFEALAEGVEPVASGADVLAGSTGSMTVGQPNATADYDSPADAPPAIPNPARAKLKAEAEAKAAAALLPPPKPPAEKAGRTDDGCPIYVHNECGKATTMRKSTSALYARDPAAYEKLLCSFCRRHYPVGGFTLA